MELVLLMVVFAPLAGALAVGMGAPGRRVSLLAAGTSFFGALALALRFPTGEAGYHFVSSLPCARLEDWFVLDLAFGVDGVSLPMVLLASLVSLAAVWCSRETVRRGRDYYVSLLLIAFGALAAFASLNLFFIFAFHEVALVPTLLLMGIWGWHDRRHAAVQMAVYLMLGSMVLLAGLLAFYFAMPAGVRTLDLRELGGVHIGAAAQTAPVVWLVLGCGILVSLFPFHTWAPAGYAAAPVAAAMLHAGVLKKFGIYLLLRLALPLLPSGMAEAAPWLVPLLLGNLLFVGLVTLQQRYFDWLLGYSSVMHMGYLFLGLVAGNVLGAAGVVLLMVGHGLSTALLFAVAGEVRERAGTVRMSELGGMAARAPTLAVFLIFGALAALGLPGLANFSGEILVYFGAWKEHPWVTAAAVWGVVISAVYLLRAVRQVCFGPVAAAVEPMVDLEHFWERVPFLLLTGGLLWVGMNPGSFLQWIGPVLSGQLPP